MRLFETPGPNYAPFTYPGNKTFLKNLLRPLIGAPERLVSPFLGAGAVEIDACVRGVPVMAADIDPHLVECWHSLLEEPAAVTAAIKKLWPTEEDDLYGGGLKAWWGMLNEYHERYATRAERAAIFLFRKTYSYGANGVRPRRVDRNRSTLSPGLDYNYHSTRRSKLLEGYYLPNFVVRCQDWETTLCEQSGIQDFWFLDPPYPGRERQLYACEPLDWELFYGVLECAPQKWCLTIAADEETEAWFPQPEFTWRTWERPSGASEHKKRYTETIITNFE